MTDVLTRCDSGMRTFRMERRHDVGGVSGTGVVLEGVEFSTGKVVAHWLTPAPTGSLVIWDSMEQFRAVHIYSHPENQTVMYFDDGEVWEAPK